MSQQYPQYTHDPNQQVPPGRGAGPNPPFNPQYQQQLLPKKPRRWDIKPGTYRNGNEGDCYWARLRNTNGDLDSIIANGNGGNQVITIKRTDKAFETRYCGTWTRLN
jgi:hypothetical protein